MPIYADANATYPVLPSHYDDVIKVLKVSDGNPSSIHGQGRKAKVALEDARGSIAAMIGSRPLEVVFTSGATESNNMVIHGLIRRCHGEGHTKPHVLVCEVEHRSVYEPAKILHDRGEIELEMIPVDSKGQVHPHELVKRLRDNTALVCVMAANNEIGSINNTEELSRVIREHSPKAHFHCDAVQLMGKSDIRWIGRGAVVDSASFSGHKIGAFKGSGALYLRSGCKFAQFMSGGGQERGRRPGTENIPGIVSFGIRCREVFGKEAAYAESMRLIRNHLVEGIELIRGGVVHGPGADWTLPNTVHFHIDGVPGDDILLNFDLEGIQVSSGSACSSGSARPSHVVMALGLGEWVALNSIRMSFSAENTLEEAQRIIEVLRQVTLRVRGN